MRKPNDVGVGWKETNDRGEYISIRLDLAVLVEMNGGVVADGVRVSMYPVVSDTPRAPDYQLKFYPKKDREAQSGSAPPRMPARASQPPLTDDDPIPF